MSETTCRCGTPTRDDAAICEDCLTDLSRDLAECPWLDEQIDISITRQRGAGTTGGPRGTETPLPWHDKASEAQRGLHAVLAGWVMFCDAEHVRHSSPGTAMPADTIAAMSRWLMWRVDGLAFHELGGNAVSDVSKATEQVRNIVFYKPLPRVYLGGCDAKDCDGDVYAEAAQTLGYCQVCAMPYAVATRLKAMEDQLDDRLCTAAEIARLSTYLGLDGVTRERVRKQVNQWHARDQIAPAGHDRAGDPRFRYGSVRALLYATYATRESA